MRVKQDGSKVLTAEVTLSIVVKVDSRADYQDFIKSEVEFIAESNSKAGSVVAVNLKSIKKI